jgi:hypothetical protein
MYAACHAGSTPPIGQIKTHTQVGAKLWKLRIEELDQKALSFDAAQHGNQLPARESSP